MDKIVMPVTKPYYVFNGFHAGLLPKKIINMKQYGGKNYFLVKWRLSEEPTYLEAEIAIEKCPLLVCLFFEEHLIFEDDEK